MIDLIVAFVYPLSIHTRGNKKKNKRKKSSTRQNKKLNDFIRLTLQ